MAAMPPAGAWSPLAVEDDPLLFMPGSQPAAGINLPKVSACTKCHGDYDPAVEPGHTLEGSMMAQATRDPLWLACLTVAEQDSIWAVGTPNAGDLCIRCHSPSGWLAGRSDPTNLTALDAGKGDFEGLTCAFCHRLADPLLGLDQPDVPPEVPGSDAATAAAATKALDRGVMQNITMFDGTTPFFDTATDLPANYEVDQLTKYIEAAGGQFFVDPADNRRGPRPDGDPTHQFYYSRFTASRAMCATCHDVSNPILANLTIAPDASGKQSAASYFHVERTFSEFQLSAYGAIGGAPTNPAIAATGQTVASRCQDCHMPRVSGKLCDKNNVPSRPDAAMHDLTGGNVWMGRILASVDTDSGNPAFDAYNHAILSGKHDGAAIDIAGLEGSSAALLDGADRALANLQRAADLVVVRESASQATVRIVNNTGHKLISGFPEGRRMWLSVHFVDATGTEIPGTAINPYEDLVTGTDGEGNLEHVSGGTLRVDRDDLVFEAKMSSTLTGEDKTFHFALATDRYKDNRIPPKGFVVAGAMDRLVQPRDHGADALDYFTAEEYAGGYDEVSFEKHPGAAGWVARLHYQTTSKEYVEFLRDEINATGTPTLGTPPSGEAQAYIVQTDPFFETLKGWGDAIWDLWLNNDGAAPVEMTATISQPAGMTMSIEADGTHLGFGTIVGRSYQVEVSNDLGPASWAGVGAEVTGDGSPAEVVDAAAPAHSRRFYRVVSWVTPGP